MLDIKDEEKEVWLTGQQKNLTINFDDGTSITNDDIFTESMTIEQTLSDENNIKYGKCSASVFKVRIYDTPIAFKNRRIKVKLSCGGYIHNLGVYTVYSDNRTDDRMYKDIVAYDAIYTASNIDCTEWYNSLTFPLSLKDFRDEFFSFIGIEQENDKLPNDSLMVEKTIDPSEISGRVIMEAICELNARFGQINSEGKFKYVFIENNLRPLYPSNDLYPSDNLFPKDEMQVELTPDDYAQGSFKYEDYKTQEITSVCVREQEGDVGGQSGEGNTYYITGNFLAYGQNQESLYQIADNILKEVSMLSYSPANIKTMHYLPWVEIGDIVKVTGYADSVVFPILKRTISGISAAKDTYSAKGEETATENKTSISDQITQLKGQSNILKRDIYETQSTVTTLSNTVDGEVEKLQTSIKQNSSAISLEASRAAGAEESLSSKITLTADTLEAGISSAKTEAINNANSSTDEKLKSYSTTTEVESKITASAEGLTLDYQKKISTAEANANSATDEKLKSYSTTTEMKRTIDLSAEGVLTTVSTTYASLDEFGNLEERVDTAESKITDSAIINTVTSSDSYKTLSTVATQTAKGFDWLIDGDGTNTQFSISDAGMKFIGDNVEIEASQVTFTASDYNVLSNNITLSGNNIHLDGNTVVGNGFSLGWANLPDDVADSDDIPTDINQLSDASGQKWSTTIGENWLRTTNVLAQNLEVNASRINGTLQVSQIDAISINDMDSNSKQYLNSRRAIWNLSAPSSSTYTTETIENLATPGAANYWVIEQSTSSLSVGDTAYIKVKNTNGNYAYVISEITGIGVNNTINTVSQGYYDAIPVTAVIKNINADGSTDVIDANKLNINGIVNFINNNVSATTINGDKITTGTITADKININNLFSQTISATGEITSLNKIVSRATVSDSSRTELDTGVLRLYNSNNIIKLLLSPATGINLYNNDGVQTFTLTGGIGASAAVGAGNIEIGGNISATNGGSVSASAFYRNGTEIVDIFNQKISIGYQNTVIGTDGRNVPTGSSWTNLGSFSLGPGLWLMIISVAFSTNASGYRSINISTSSGGAPMGISYWDQRQAVNGAETICKIIEIFETPAGSTTYYINGRQGSGSYLTANTRATRLNIR